jgi:hypothetical protein
MGQAPHGPLNTAGIELFRAPPAASFLRNEPSPRSIERILGLLVHPTKPGWILEEAGLVSAACPSRFLVRVPEIESMIPAAA